METSCLRLGSVKLSHLASVFLQFHSLLYLRWVSIFFFLSPPSTDDICTKFSLFPWQSNMWKYHNDYLPFFIVSAEFFTLFSIRSVNEIELNVYCVVYVCSNLFRREFWALDLHSKCNRSSGRSTSIDKFQPPQCSFSVCGDATPPTGISIVKQRGKSTFRSNRKADFPCNRQFCQRNWARYVQLEIPHEWASSLYFSQF